LILFYCTEIYARGVSISFADSNTHSSFNNVHITISISITITVITAILFIFTVQSQGKCAKLPIESSSGKKDYWAGTWKYFQDQERSIIIENNGDIKGDNDFSGGVCEDLVITKEHSATSAFVHGHLIYRM